MGFIATRPGEGERGPQVRMNSDEAARRILISGELVWVQGPRSKDLAPLAIDDAVPRGGVVLRDIIGVTVSEIVRISKPDFDTTTRRHFA